MRCLLLVATASLCLLARAELDTSIKCTICTKVGEYIIPVIREAGHDVSFKFITPQSKLAGLASPTM